MPLFFVFFVLLVSVPLVELYLLIQVGRSIGAGTTIAIVILTAALGAWLLRWQGLVTLARARGALEAGELPATELVEGLILLVTGVLLLTPGFVTDALGFLLLLPAVRHGLARGLTARLVVRAIGPGGRGGPGEAAPARTIEADFRVEDDPSRR